MEAKTSLVRTNSTVELNAIANVYMYFAVVVCPRYAESDDTLGFYEALDELSFLKLRMLVVNVLNRNEHFADCLQVLGFARVFSLKGLHNLFDFHSKRFLVDVIDFLSFCHFDTANIAHFSLSTKKKRGGFRFLAYF